MKLFQSLSLAIALLVSASADAAPAHNDHWVTSWLASSQPAWTDDFILPTGVPARVSKGSIREIVQLSAGGTALRVVLSNRYGKLPLEIGEVRLAASLSGAATVAGSDRSLTFAGRRSVRVAPGALALSDPLAVTAAPLSRLAVTIYLPDPTALSTFHWGSQQTSFVAPGNLTAAPAWPSAQTFAGRAFVNAVQVLAPQGTGSVIALGDSITDGNGSTLDSNRRWPDRLARRLVDDNIAVANAGISGARLLRDGMGLRASARFNDDVLNQPGVRSVVVALGVNDIGWPGTPFAPHETLPTAAAMIEAYRQLIAAAHARHVRIIGATITPFEGALPGTPFAGLYATPAKEALRQQVNRWIRDSAAFDAVADFDAVVRDPDHPARLLAQFDSGDHLHPGDAGYAAMATTLSTEILFGP
jgi:lysophospholipase L1-like esterase